jgi:hypothetical protein
MKKKFEYIVYIFQHRLGVVPHWEQKLRINDDKLRTFHSEANCGFNDGWVCKHYEELYHNRLNFLKGWIEKL